MTSHQKKQKIAKKVQPKKVYTDKKSNPQQEIDEGFWNRLLGRESSMTPQQQEAVKKFTASFVGNAVGAIDREIKAGKINPKATATSTAPAAPATSTAPRTGRTVPTPSTTTPSTSPVTESQIRYQKLNKLFESILAEQTPTPMSISHYLDTVYLPFYLKKRKIPDDTLPTVNKLTKQIETDWSKNKGKVALEQLAGIVYNMLYLGTLGSDEPAGGQPADGQPAGGQPAAPAGGQPADGQPAGGQSVTDDSLFSPIERNWDRLTRQQKRTLKSRVAGLT